MLIKRFSIAMLILFLGIVSGLVQPANGQQKSYPESGLPPVIVPHSELDLT
jgi:hypothetical protein